MRKALPVVALAFGAILAIAPRANANLNLEGQYGLGLNPMAYTVKEDKFEAGTHYVNLSNMGQLNSYAVAYGVRKDLEVCYARITSNASVLHKQNIFEAKWKFVKEDEQMPAIALWAQEHDLENASNALDIGICATKEVKFDKYPVVMDLGVRSTKVKWDGLAGIANKRKLKYEGGIALKVHKQLSIGVEFKEQIGMRTWTDVAARYLVNDHLTIDAALVNIEPGLNKQFALGVTWKQ